MTIHPHHGTVDYDSRQVRKLRPLTMPLRLIYVTCENREEALKIANETVKNRLAACANIIGDITSVYWWDGTIQEGQEVALILKTREDLTEKLTAKIMELHSYTCPCVVAFPIEGGNSAFLDWIESETRS